MVRKGPTDKTKEYGSCYNKSKAQGQMNEWASDDWESKEKGDQAGKPGKSL